MGLCVSSMGWGGGGDERKVLHVFFFIMNRFIYIYEF